MEGCSRKKEKHYSLMKKVYRRPVHVKIAFKNIKRLLDIICLYFFSCIWQFLKSFTFYRSCYVLGCGRSSPIWDITKSAKTADISDRVEALSHPKVAHREYQPPRGVRIELFRS